MTKPILRWPGGKTRALLSISPLLPTNYNYYHEPFIGGGAMFLNIKPEFAYIGDLDSGLINVYNVIKHSPESLIEALKTHSHSEYYYYKIRGKDRNSNFNQINKIEKASRFIYLNKTCFNGHMRYNRRGEFNSGWGKLKNPALPSANEIMDLHKLFRGIRIGYQSFLSSRGMINKGDFVYLDPPYDKEVETSMDSYLNGGFGINGQFSLFSYCVWLDKVGAKFMVSNADTPRINRMFKDFNINKINVTRTFSRNNALRGKAKEVVITNY